MTGAVRFAPVVTWRGQVYVLSAMSRAGTLVCVVETGLDPTDKFAIIPASTAMTPEGYSLSTGLGVERNPADAVLV